MTAAHKSLQFGTRVRVNNLANGNRVVVRIYVRGPFVMGRIIVMSYNAAGDLEMITAGGGMIYACKLAVDMFKLEKEDLHEEVDSIITIGDFYGLCDGDRTQIIFT